MNKKKHGKHMSSDREAGNELELEREGTVGDFLDRIANSAENFTRKGEALERLFREIAKSDPALDVEEIDLYSEWARERGDPLFSYQDRGIDLVAKLNSGEYVGIQCKFYERSIRKREIDSFLGKLATRTEEGGPFFSLGWIVSTAPLSPGVKEDLDSHICDIRPISIWKYRDEVLKTGALFDKRNTRPYQDEAIMKVEKAFMSSDSGKLIMACGTGKTFTALCAMEKIVPENGSVLFCAPTIALVSQVRAEWLRQANSSIDARVVCSDSSAGRVARSRGVPLLVIQELECPVTNDPKRLAEFLKKDAPGRIKVIFTTYQSLKHIKKAQEDATVPSFDLVIADEAHKTTGAIRSRTGRTNGSPTSETRETSIAGNQDESGNEIDNGFRMIHNREDIRANKRLYMTATPRVYSNTKALRTKGYEITDMNDTDVYGNTILHYKFKQAVEDGYLCDYRLIMLRIHEGVLTPSLIDKVKQGNFSNDEMTRLFGTMLAIRGNSYAGEDNTRTGILHRTIAFANTIARSKWYCEMINSREMKTAVTISEKNINEDGSYFGAGMEIECKHLDGNDQVVERIKALQKLQDAKKNNRAEILSNVGIFSEGVDVPSLNAVAFLDPRSSKIDILQAVGRVMRRPENPEDKRIGYIIVPVVVPYGTTALEDLANVDERYTPVFDVIAALQSNDESFLDSLGNKLMIQDVKPNPEQPPVDKPKNGEGDSPGIIFDPPNPGPESTERIISYVVSRIGLTRDSKGMIAADGIKTQVSNEAGKMLERGIGSKLCGLLGISEHDNDEQEACTLAALLMLNALFVHRRLQRTDILPAGNELDLIAHSSDPSQELLDSWNIILAKDYRPIFEPAIPVLSELKEWPSLCISVLKGLIECADNFGPSLSDMGWDHAGPLYHFVLGTAKSDGAFYTHNISALFLARLALHNNMADWKDPRSITNLRIMDPACGTGTLLMAVLREIKRKAKEANPAVNLDSLHKGLVENSIAGLDINRQATQLAASNLTISSTNVDYEKMNIYTMKHGIQATDSAPRLGSLEILDTKDEDVILNTLVQQNLLAEDGERERSLPAVEAARSVGRSDELSENSFPVKDLDMVIMNPPFTNAENRNSRLSGDDRNRMQEREKNLNSIIVNRDSTLDGVTDYNSIRTFFTPLADVLTSKNNGTTALIVPATACTSSAGLQERCWMANNWHVEKMVSNHDPKKYMFSENTSIHEVLVIARRSSSPPPPFRTLST